MPELPEVETVVRGLRQPLVGRTIIGMWHDWDKTLRSPSPQEFAARVAGQTVRGIGRRAKYILIELEHDVLVVHLKMSGRLYVASAEDVHAADRWVHVRFDLDGGKQLRFSDMRKFGVVYLTDDVSSLLGHLGPEPLDQTFTLAGFREGLKGRRRSIKAHLLDQEIVAGIGNIYADEALFRAGIHPNCMAGDVTDEDAERLHQTIRDALLAGIQHEGASINWYRKADGGKGESQKHFFVYGRMNLACRKCGATINKIRVAQRGTHFCPNCQPERIL